MFPDGQADESPKPQRFDRDGFIVFVTETKMSLQHLTEAVKMLSVRVAELADRFDADADELRGSMNGITDLTRRVATMELKVASLEVRLAALETWRTQQTAWLAAIGFIAGILGSVGSFFFSKLLK